MIEVKRVVRKFEIDGRKVSGMAELDDGEKKERR